MMLTAAALAAALAVGCAETDDVVLTEEEALAQGAVIDRFDDAGEEDVGDAVAFHPVDCGLQAQEAYEYPYIGLNFKLTQDMLLWMDSRDVFAETDEAISEDVKLEYAMVQFFAPTQEQKDVEGVAIDYAAWKDGLERIGVLGAYRTESSADNLDALTGCDEHTKLGESADGAYEYVLSTNSNAGGDYAGELKRTQIEIVQMWPINLEYGCSAFSAGREDDVPCVGDFTTQDVFGEVYTQDMFGEYDLTLVNAFATWCSPCVNEMPELEQLRQAFEEKGVKLGVVAMVMDARTSTGVDQGILIKAQLLHELCGAQFPFLIPDEGALNGRLSGLEAYPESFFVDTSGKIVGESYLGARDVEQWTKIVEQELAKLEGAN